MDIAWDRDTLQGSALAAIDVIQALQSLASIRRLRWPGLTWRWLAPPGERLAAGLPPPPTPAPPGCADLLLIPGWQARSGPDLLAKLDRSAWLAQAAVKVHGQGKPVLALHTGVLLLARAGLLAGRDAVAPWPFIPTLMRLSSDVRLRGDVAWTADGGIWTAASPALAMQLLLHALGRVDGAHAQGLAELAQAVSEVLLHVPERQQAAVQLQMHPVAKRVPPGAVERARRHLEEHPEQAYDLTQLAAVAAASARTLLRHFEASLGLTPLAYLQGLRTARAKVLLETTYLSVEQVALACGYAHQGTFRRLFRSATGLTPSAYRDRHRLRVLRPQWGSETRLKPVRAQ